MRGFGCHWGSQSSWGTADFRENDNLLFPHQSSRRNSNSKSRFAGVQSVIVLVPPLGICNPNKVSSAVSGRWLKTFVHLRRSPPPSRRRRNMNALASLKRKSRSLSAHTYPDSHPCWRAVIMDGYSRQITTLRPTVQRSTLSTPTPTAASAGLDMLNLL